MSIVIRPARLEDRAAVELVESQATRNLQYLPAVYSEFAGDRDGEFSVAEVDGQIAGCGKFTVLPDGTAWLEALRVTPEFQGRGVGKAFYNRFFELAHLKDIKVMRMYTGAKNVVSKGLAERFGFHLAATCRRAGKAVQVGDTGATDRFREVADINRAAELLMPLKAGWPEFVAMNRTFYELTPALCRVWAAEGKVYEDAGSGSVVALGARFMPEQAVHLAAFGGNNALCLAFAESLAVGKGVGQVQCMFPPTVSETQDLLLRHGFSLDQSDFIVMQVEVGPDGKVLRRP